ncbi:MAG TPA: dihydroorotate dehydrogenase-like protein [Gaiellales bacterium]|jgi:dihydroorotate dehydrogenase (fumarate)|nr:dihydroorotate dehydrogenase-like protein [Gaiellales bacterium]
MDLSTTYMGMELRNPLVASASPMSQTVDGIRGLEQAGVGAVVLYSLFEEQLQREAAAFAVLGSAGTESFAEALTYMPSLADGAGTSRHYLSLLERARSAVEIPLIGSLNGITPQGWTDHARAIEEAGADAIELNMYDVPGDPRATGRDVEQRQLDVLHKVLDAVRLPVAVKMSPFYSSTGEMARRLDEAGARGLVLFNRFMQPDIDADTLAISSRIELSTPADQRLPQTWIAILRGRVGASLAASGGVESPADVARFLLAGADVVMTASALLRHGRGHARTLVDGLQEWAGAKGFSSLDDLRGLLSLAREADPEARQRAGYVGVLEAARQTFAPW